MKKKIVLRGVNFDFDKYNIRSDAVPILEQACKTLKAEPSIDVSCQGHTDSVGTEQYNQGLSVRRADCGAQLARQVRHPGVASDRQGLRRGRSGGVERHRRGSRSEPSHRAGGHQPVSATHDRNIEGEAPSASPSFFWREDQGRKTKAKRSRLRLYPSSRRPDRLRRSASQFAPSNGVMRKRRSRRRRGSGRSRRCRSGASAARRRGGCRRPGRTCAGRRRC